jgi:hypothetical protein
MQKEKAMNMKLNAIVATLLAAFALAGCGGGVELGGPGPDPVDAEMAGDDPLDGGVINSGSGSVIP